MKVTLIAVVSVDGFITRHQFPGTSFASHADQDYFRRTLLEFDCSILGANTYRQSREQILAGIDAQRLRVVLTRNPGKFSQEACQERLEFTDQDPRSLVEGLEARGYQQCALLGGSQINTLFLAHDLINEWWITVEPVVFGSGLPLSPGSWNRTLALISVSHLSKDTLLLKYKR